MLEGEASKDSLSPMHRILMVPPINIRGTISSILSIQLTFNHRAGPGARNLPPTGGTDGLMRGEMAAGSKGGRQERACRLISTPISSSSSSSMHSPTEM